MEGGSFLWRLLDELCVIKSHLVLSRKRLEAGTGICHSQCGAQAEQEPEGRANEVKERRQNPRFWLRVSNTTLFQDFSSSSGIPAAAGRTHPCGEARLLSGVCKFQSQCSRHPANVRFLGNIRTSWPCWDGWSDVGSRGLQLEMSGLGGLQTEGSPECG